MSVKTTQEAGEIWYHSEEKEHYVLVEYIDKFSWNESDTHQWKAFSITTGSLESVYFNIKARDYNVWEFVG